MLLAIKSSYYNMPKNNILEFFTIALLILLTTQQCCQKFSQQLCIQCPQGMHLYRSNCIFDLPNCIEYQSGFDCSRCRQGWQLTAGKCVHPRYNLNINRLANFTPFLQSAVKPDLIFQQAQKQLAVDSQLWVDWYNYTALMNRQFMSPNTLMKKAMDVQATLLGSAGSQVHYVCTTIYSLNNTQLTIYRLTFILSNNQGYADLYFLVEKDGNHLGYLQVCEVEFQLLQGSSWQPLSKQFQSVIGSALSRYFLMINQQELLKGYWKENNSTYNITIFYLDKDVGAVSYVYIGTSAELLELGITSITTSTTQAPQTNGTLSGNTTTTTDSSHKENSGNNSSQQTYNSTPSIDASKANSIPPLPSPTSKPNQTVIEPSNPPTNQHSATSAVNGSESEQKVSLGEIHTNPIYAAGQAVAVQYGYISANSEVIALSLFPVNNSRAIYFLSSGNSSLIYSKLIFWINAQINQFVIAFFQQSNKNICPWLQPDSANQNITNTSTSIPKNASNASNSQSTNNTASGRAQSNQTTNNSRPPTPSPAVNISALPNNQPTSTLCPQLNNFETIDITNQTGSDLFLPKINLLLMSMYSQDLQNCRIVDAKYSWILNNAVLVKSIRYNLTYGCQNDTKYLFVAEISNNQLQFISKPEGIKQLGTVEQGPNQVISSNTTIQDTTPNASNSSAQDNLNSKDAAVNNNSSETKQLNTPDPSNNRNNTVQPTNNSQNKQINNQSNTNNSTIITNNATIRPNIVIINNIQPSNLLPTPTPPTTNSTPTPQPPNPNPNSNSTSSPSSQQPRANVQPPSPSNLFPIPTPATATQSSISSNSSQNSGNSAGKGNGSQLIKKTLIPESSFRSDPRYKSIIQIVKSIKRLPVNVTVSEMYTWSTLQQFQYFTILFQMPFKQPLSDGSTKKLFYFEVEVNPSSYVTITNSTISFLDDSPPPAPKQPTLSLPLDPAQSGAGISSSNRSPYSQQLINILSGHAPVLKQLRADVVSFAPVGSEFGGIVQEFNEIIGFQSNLSKYCYLIHYKVVTASSVIPSCKSSFELVKYELTNCTVKDSNVFAYVTNEAHFQAAPENIEVRDRIKAFFGSDSPIFFEYAQIKQIFKVVYSSRGINHTIIMDTVSMLVLMYEADREVVHTPQISHLSKGELSLVSKQVQKQLGLINGTFQIFYISRMLTCQNSVSLLDLYAIQKNLIEWGIQLEIGLKLQMIYNVKEQKVSTINRSNIDLPANPGYFTNYYAMNSYYAIKWERLLGSSEFPYIMASLQTIYPSFLQGSKILAFLTSSKQSTAQFFNKTISRYISAKMIIVKQFTKNYFAFYVITIDYNPLNMDVKVKAVEALPTNALQIRNCDKVTLQSSLPTCDNCSKGYIVSDGRCWSSMESCRYNFRGICLSCEEGYGSSTFGRCRQKEEVGQIYLSLLNLYELGRKKV